MIKRTLWPALMAGIAIALAGCGGGSASSNASTTNTGNTESSGTHAKQINPLHKLHNVMSGSVINVNMGAMNGSKQDGSASVTQKGKTLSVAVHVFNEPKGASEPAHIHKGTCKKLDPVPYRSLSNVVNGTSNTTVTGLSIAEIKKGHFAINVHKSLKDLKVYVSCGDLTP